MDCHHTTCSTVLPAGMRPDARYCSDACRMAAVTERRRAQRPERPQRECACCSKPFIGSGTMCRRCLAEENRPQKTDVEVALLRLYAGLAETLQEFEKEAEHACFQYGMSDIIYWLASADESPLTRDEKERL